MSTLFERNGRLYLRFYDNLVGHGREIGTGEKADRLGWIEARKFKKRFDAQLETGLIRSRFQKAEDNIYLSEAFEEFIQEKTTGPDKIALKTEQTYKRIINYLIEACSDKPLRNYTSKDYKKLHTYLESKIKDNPFPEKQRYDKAGNKKPLKPKRKITHNTISGYYRYLHHFFNHFIKIVPENPIIVTKPQKKLPEAIPEDDLKLIMDALCRSHDPNQYDMIYFLLWSGFRANEACQLDWSQININTRMIMFENMKGKIKFDNYPLHNELYNHLKKIGIKKRGKVFPYSGPDQLGFFDKIQNGLDIRKHYTVHQLRKTFASRCVNAGMSPFDLMKLMRHKDIKTTLEYYTEADLKRIGREVDSRVKDLVLYNIPKDIPKQSSGDEANEKEKPSK